jgi:hypothetical protein
MTAIRPAVLTLFIMLTATACVRSTKNRFQKGEAPVYSITAERREALSSMIAVVIDDLPAPRGTICLAFDTVEYGWNYQYRPDSVLLRLLGERRKVVVPKDCPASYGRGAWEVGQTPRQPPPGYINPYFVHVTRQQYAGPESAGASLVAGQEGYGRHYICSTRRDRPRSWRATCRLTHVEYSS